MTDDDYELGIDHPTTNPSNPQETDYFQELKEEYVETGKYAQLYVELFHEADASVDEALNITRQLRQDEEESALKDMEALLE